MKRKREVVRAQRAHQLVAQQDEFRHSMAARFRLEQATRRLGAARALCERLDRASGITEPTDPSFWPPDETRARLLAQSELIRKEICQRPEVDPRRRKQKRLDEETDDIDSDSYQSEKHQDDECSKDLQNVDGEIDDELCDLDAAQHGPIESNVSFL